MKYFNEIENAPLHELKALQSQRLSRTVRRVYENVPFYRKKFDEMGITPDDIKSVEDVVKLPFTVKTDLRDNYPFGMFACPMEDVVEIHASSGTTGKQTVVGYTKNDIDIWGDVAARALVAAGGTKNDIIHVAFGYGLFTGGLGMHYAASKLGAAVIPISAGNTKRQIQIMKDFGSTILCCTPSYAIFIGETLKEMGIDPRKELALRAGIFGAEPWTEEMRLEIEKLLGVKAYDIYGLSEIIGPGVSYECCEQKGMHVCEDNFIIETINPETGIPVADGELGELVFTCITKEAFPLIRYRTRDLAVLNKTKCSCGRTHVRMSKPCGRTDDMLIIRGVNVFPSQVESALLELGLTSPHYILIVDRVGNLDTLEVMVELNDGTEFDAVRLVEQKSAKIRAAIESTLGVSAKVQLVSPKTIERSEGKAKRVIDKRNI